MVTYSERLSAQDSSFLLYEDRDAHAHMHIGGVSIYEGSGLTTGRGGVDIERFRSYVASRLHLIPRYRQRLAYTPMQQLPLWVDDDHFNVRYHVRHTRLPHPGDVRELKRLAGRIMSQRLDRTRPLWELWIIEGLHDGQFAMVTKTHHCMMDGASGVDIATVLMQMSPDAPVDEPQQWSPRPAPAMTALAVEELRDRLGVPLVVGRAVADVVRGGTQSLPSFREHLGSFGRLAGLAWQGPAHTPLNRPIGPHRRFDWTDVPLDEAKAIKNRLGGTLNDVVLAIVAGALGAFLRRRRVNVDVLDFIASIPVNARAAGDRSMGNQVAAWLAQLPIAERDPRRRLERVVAVTTELKHHQGSDPTGYLFPLAELGGGPAVRFVVQLMQRLTPCNVVVSNVPGPPFPLYLLGARMREAYPMVTLLAGQAVGIAVFSYCGRLGFGFNADWDLVPDLHDLVLDLERGYDELRAAAAA